MGPIIPGAIILCLAHSPRPRLTSVRLGGAVNAGNRRAFSSGFPLAQPLKRRILTQRALELGRYRIRILTQQ